MVILHDPVCLEYRTPGHPERPERCAATAERLRATFPGSCWPAFEEAPEAALLRAHTAAHLERLGGPTDFDADTAWHPGIREIAGRATGAFLEAVRRARAGEPAFSLMRPPGHHAEGERAMGFCYINHVAVAALEALASGAWRVAVWDFDAHHGNGTEALLEGVQGALYVSVHQHPCFPGTGLASRGNCLNCPVAPLTPPEEHLALLERSWRAVLDFEPELALVSAGFDAYEGDPITQMTLRADDFRTLGSWLARSGLPVAALLEGGYSEELPELGEAFLAGWGAA